MTQSVRAKVGALGSRQIVTVGQGPGQFERRGGLGDGGVGIGCGRWSEFGRRRRGTGRGLGREATVCLRTCHRPRPETAPGDPSGSEDRHEQSDEPRPTQAARARRINVGLLAQGGI